MAAPKESTTLEDREDEKRAEPVMVSAPNYGVRSMASTASDEEDGAEPKRSDAALSSNELTDEHKLEMDTGRAMVDGVTTIKMKMQQSEVEVFGLKSQLNQDAFAVQLLEKQRNVLDRSREEMVAARHEAEVTEQMLLRHVADRKTMIAKRLEEYIAAIKILDLQIEGKRAELKEGNRGARDATRGLELLRAQLNDAVDGVRRWRRKVEGKWPGQKMVMVHAAMKAGRLRLSKLKGMYPAALSTTPSNDEQTLSQILAPQMRTTLNHRGTIGKAAAGARARSAEVDGEQTAGESEEEQRTD